MREYKFRGKTLDGTEWCYGYLVVKPDKQALIEQCDELRRVSPQYVVDPDTVGMYTGRCACESKKIFEGDVLEFTVFDYQGGDSQYRGVVEWCGSRFIVSVHAVFARNSWRPRRDYEEEYFDLDWMLDQDDEVKIIGNVHDNPELLEAHA